MTLLSTRGLIALQIRVWLALVLREVRSTFGKSSFGYIWSLVVPTAGTGVLVFVFALAGRHAPFGSSLALFFASGLLTLQFFTELSGKLMTVFDANRALMTYPVIKEVDVIIARSLVIIITYFFIMLIFFSTLIGLGLAGLPARGEQVLFAFLTTAFLGTGLGIVNAVLSSLWESWVHLEKILTRPLFFISGIFYQPSSLPSAVQDILKWNPVLHLIEWFRDGYYPNYYSSILDKSYPLLLALSLVLIGLTGERLFRKLRI